MANLNGHLEDSPEFIVNVVNNQIGFSQIIQHFLFLATVKSKRLSVAMVQITIFCHVLCGLEQQLLPIFLCTTKF